MVIRNAVAAVTLLSMGMMYGAAHGRQRLARYESERALNEQITMQLYSTVSKEGNVSWVQGDVIKKIRDQQENNLKTYLIDRAKQDNPSTNQQPPKVIIISRSQGSGIPLTRDTANTALYPQNILAVIKSRQSYPGTH